MNIYMWIGIGIPLLMIGALINVRNRPMMDALESAGQPSGKYRTRSTIGLGIAAFACVLMNIGSLTSDVSGALKVVSALLTVLLLVTWLSAITRLRRGEID